jgi:predicted SnoaL-like aldol condensation-catalyzing enzyme
MKKILLLFAVAGLLASCGNMDAGNSKREADNKAGVQRFYDQVINAHNPAMIDSFCTENFVDHDPGPGSSGKGLAELKKEMTQWFQMMPDVHITPDFIVAKGDTVIARVTMSGNSMMMPNMPPGNKPYTATGIDIIVLNKDGKATDRWGAFDMMGAMMSAGMMGGPPAPADSAAMGQQKM